MSRNILVSWALALLAPWAGACDPSTCGREGLSAALAAAAPGDVVELGACRVEGSFVVPAGVVLRGRGGGSVLASDESGEVVVTLLAGPTTTRLEGVRVESDSRAAVVVRGAGSATLERVQVELSRGLGVGIDGAGDVTSDVTLSEVGVSGPFLASSASDPRWLRVLGAPVGEGSCPSASCECEPGEMDEAGARLCDADGRWSTWTATFGVYARRARLSLRDVEISGVASHGLVADQSALDWQGGAVREVIGVGVLLRGGSSVLEDVEVERVVQGLRGVASYGVVATDAHELTSARLRVADGERYGLLQLEASGAHTDLDVRGNGDAGVWVGGAAGFTMDGESAIADNGFAGVVIADSREVRIAGGTIEGTRTVRRSVGMFGALEVGDGIHLTGSYEGVRLEQVRLRGNQRAGLLVDLGPASAHVVFDGLEVEASGAALGAVAGVRDVAGGVVRVGGPAGWDSGITRLGAAAVNDAAITGELDAVVTAGPHATEAIRGLVAPMY